MSDHMFKPSSLTTNNIIYFCYKNLPLIFLFFLYLFFHTSSFTVISVGGVGIK